MRPLLLTLALVVASPARAAPFTVCLDPGHGGPHDGALNPKKVKEKDVSLAVGQLLKTLLEARGDLRVVMTRDHDADVGLHDRTAVANGARADLLVSIHCNSMPTQDARKSSTGIETYFLSADATDADAHALADRENADAGEAGHHGGADPISLILEDLSRSQAHQDSALLADDIHRTLVKALKTKDRGVRQAPFIVLLGAEMPAVLVEIGFISHPAEGLKLAKADYQRQVAESLRDAILAYRRDVWAHRTAPAAALGAPPEK